MHNVIARLESVHAACVCVSRGVCVSQRMYMSNECVCECDCVHVCVCVCVCVWMCDTERVCVCVCAIRTKLSLCVGKTQSSWCSVIVKISLSQNCVQALPCGDPHTYTCLPTYTRMVEIMRLWFLNFFWSDSYLDFFRHIALFMFTGFLTHFYHLF